MNQETKVGAFLLFAVATILTGILFLGNIKIFSRTHRYYIDFHDVEALPPKAAVKISGVEIGKVDRVDLVDGRARVTIGLKPEIHVYEDAVGRIGSTGIIGTRFVELFPGTPSHKELEVNSTIRGADGNGLNQMISKLSGLFDEDEKYGNAVDNIKATLANIRRVSDSLNRALGNHGEDLEETVENIRELTQHAKVFTKHLEEISTEHKEDVKVALAKFRDVAEKLDKILSKIDKGEGTIGALVSDEKTAKDVKEAVASFKDTAGSAKKVLGRFTMINTYWDYRYRYDTRDEEGRSDVGITFVPRPGKFYSFGATNVGEPIDDEKNKAYERKNRINAVMGADYGPFTGYVGAIRSRGGFGGNFRPFWKSNKYGRRFELNAEAADFSRDRVVNGRHLDSAWVAAGAHYAVTRWWWLGVRGEDLLERSAFQAYTNIIIRDEDLSYLFGFLTFAH